MARLQRTAPGRAVPAGRAVARTPSSAASATGRLLALQRSAGNQAVGQILARQPAPGGGIAPAPDPPAPVRHPPSLRVRIVAHASPRWRSAKDAKAADAENQQLSEQRALEVQTIIDEQLRDILGPDARIEYQHLPAEEDDSVSITSESHGSKDTLGEAKGNRSADDEYLRRVEVFVERLDHTTEQQEVLNPSYKHVVKSTWWSVNLKSSHTISAGGAGTLLDLTLRNEETKREAHVYIPTGGGGTPGLSTSASVGGDPVLFYTDEPMGFEDFHNVIVRYSAIGFGLVFFGWEKAYLSFMGLGDGAKELDVGGWNVGAQLKLGGGVTFGPLKFYGGGNGADNDIYTVPPSIGYEPLERLDSEKDLHITTFPTGKHKPSAKELEALMAFIIDLGYRFRDS